MASELFDYLMPAPTDPPPSPTVTLQPLPTATPHPTFAPYPGA